MEVVLMNLEETIRLSADLKKSYIELLETLTEAEDDVKNGRLAPISETFDDLRAMLLEEYSIIRTNVADEEIRKIK